VREVDFAMWSGGIPRIDRMGTLSCIRTVLVPHGRLRNARADRPEHGLKALFRLLKFSL